MTTLLLVNSPKIVSVSLYRNAAVLKRAFKVKLPEGEAEVKVDNLETTLHPDSIRIRSDPKVMVRSFDFFTYKKLLKEMLEEEEEELRERIRELEATKFGLESEIKNLRTISSSLDFSFFPLMISYSIGSVLGRASEDGLRESFSTLLEERKKNTALLSDKMQKLEEVKAELESLKSRLKEISGKTMEVGALTMDVASGGGEIAFEITYSLDGASWSPTYDILVKDRKVKVVMFANVIQNTPFKWEDVFLTISSKPVARAVKPDLTPWYIEPQIPRPAMKASPRMAKRAKVMRLEEFELEKAEMAMEMAEVLVGEYVTYAPKAPITIEPKKPRRIALEELEFDSDVRYVWDAYTQPGFVSIAGFKNAGRALLPGRYRVYEEGLFVGKGDLPLISPGQKVELPLTTDERLEAKREIILREEERKGVLKGKAYIRMGYRLKVKSHKDEEVDVRVYDRIPLSKHPDVHVELEKSEPNPDKTEMGILEWNFKIKPEEERKIVYHFVIKYPPEFSIPIP